MALCSGAPAARGGRISRRSCTSAARRGSEGAARGCRGEGAGGHAALSGTRGSLHECELDCESGGRTGVWVPVSLSQTTVVSR